MEGLKPCPFCGVDDIVLGHKVTDDLYMVPHSWYVKCRQCGCTLFDFDTEEKAIAAWNTRKEPITIMSPITTVSPGEPQTYVPLRTCKQVLTNCDDGLMPPFTAHCSACGDEWGFTPNYCPNCGAKVVD